MPPLSFFFVQASGERKRIPFRKKIKKWSNRKIKKRERPSEALQVKTMSCEKRVSPPRLRRYDPLLRLYEEYLLLQQRHRFHTLPPACARATLTQSIERHGRRERPEGAIRDRRCCTRGSEFFYCSRSSRGMVGLGAKCWRLGTVRARPKWWRERRGGCT